MCLTKVPLCIWQRAVWDSSSRKQYGFLSPEGRMSQLWKTRTLLLQGAWITNSAFLFLWRGILSVLWKIFIVACFLLCVCFRVFFPSFFFFDRVSFFVVFFSSLSSVYALNQRRERGYRSKSHRWLDSSIRCPRRVAVPLASLLCVYVFVRCFRCFSSSCFQCCDSCSESYVSSLSVA